MKFWTSLQEPLSQAVLIDDNGNIIKKIPEKTPNTPVRKVGCVGKYKNDLIVGRRNSIEIWDINGNEQKYIINHPWIYGLHEVSQIEDDLLIACSSLDVVFRITLEGEVKWSWWAYKSGYGKKFELIDRKDWVNNQVTKNLDNPHGVHLNSGRLQDGKILISLLKSNICGYVEQNKHHFHILAKDLQGVHSPFYYNGQLCYGLSNGLVVNEVFIAGYRWVKRLAEYDSLLWFSHEEGVTALNKNLHVVKNYRLPRPFGIINYA